MTAADIISILKEGGSLAVLGVVLWAVAVRAVPAFLRELQSQRAEFIAALHRHDEEHASTMRIVLSQCRYAKLNGELRLDDDAINRRPSP